MTLFQKTEDNIGDTELVYEASITHTKTWWTFKKEKKV